MKLCLMIRVVNSKLWREPLLIYTKMDIDIWVPAQVEKKVVDKSEARLVVGMQNWHGNGASLLLSTQLVRWFLVYAVLQVTLGLCDINFERE